MDICWLIRINVEHHENRASARPLCLSIHVQNTQWRRSTNESQTSLGRLLGSKSAKNNKPDRQAGTKGHGRIVKQETYISWLRLWLWRSSLTDEHQAGWRSLKRRDLVEVEICDKTSQKRGYKRYVRITLCVSHCRIVVKKNCATQGNLKSGTRCQKEQNVSKKTAYKDSL